jgi:hypothetical protein
MPMEALLVMLRDIMLGRMLLPLFCCGPPVEFLASPNGFSLAKDCVVMLPE